ncbi:hypothetical protein BJ878DRAFT_67584 [Calycina marina]|uniref:COP9 signalosome complex subunit 3 N-terminal helical repeats domain-containing protein n=1 Tax=Calycina marina TaxID=1763456 RepID=A0A9P7Z384_9HELO|nr:hypothetical protein BJ878DRAFT_67584 [Calycina marina]
MEDILPKLLNFPPHPEPPTPVHDDLYEEHIHAHINKISAIPEKALLQQVAGGESALDVVDPSRNSASYIYVLAAYITSIGKGNKNIDQAVVWEKITIFLATADYRQLRHLGYQLNMVTEFIVNLVQPDYAAAVDPLAYAILGLDPSGSVLTTRHLNLVQMSLSSGHFAGAVPVLEKFVLYFNGNAKNPKPKNPYARSLPPSSYVIPELFHTQKYKSVDVLSYFLWSGMVYMGLQKWESALECFESAITYPSKDNSVSKIMVEAYKKWILVGILLEGKLLPLPASISSMVAKTLHAIGKPYETFALIFESGTAARLKSEADVGEKMWNNDNNAGLIFFVLAAYQKFQIRNLGKVYSKISIPEIHEETMSAESGKKLPNAKAIETLVQEMIDSGTLHASLSRPASNPAVLTLAPSGPSLPESVMRDKLAEATARIQALTHEIKEADRILTHDKEYIMHARKMRRQAKNGDQAVYGVEMEWDANEGEDLMAGVAF